MLVVLRAKIKSKYKMKLPEHKIGLFPVDDQVSNVFYSNLGDVGPGGLKIKECVGHFWDGDKPEGFDTQQIFLSPSIRYAGHDAYAKPTKYDLFYCLSILKNNLVLHR